MEENKAAGGGGGGAGGGVVANAPGEQRLTVQKVAQAERNAKHVKLKIGNVFQIPCCLHHSDTPIFVGDRLYETTVGTLVSRGGIFNSMFEQSEEVSDAYFIDQNLPHFTLVLQYLRTSTLDIPSNFGFIELIDLLKVPLIVSAQH